MRDKLYRDSFKSGNFHKFEGVLIKFGKYLLASRDNPWRIIEEKVNAEVFKKVLNPLKTGRILKEDCKREKELVS